MKKVSQNNIGTPLIFEWSRAFDAAATLTMEVVKPGGAGTVTIPAAIHPESPAWAVAYSRAGDLDTLGEHEARVREVGGSTDVRTLPDTFTVV